MEFAATPEVAVLDVVDGEPRTVCGTFELSEAKSSKTTTHDDALATRPAQLPRSQGRGAATTLGP